MEEGTKYIRWRKIEHSYMIVHKSTDSRTAFRHHSSAGGQMLIVIMKGVSKTLVGFIEMLFIIRFGAKNGYF